MFGVRGTSCDGTAAADAPPTSEKVNPAAPNTGTDFVRRFRLEACFTLGMLAFLHKICSESRTKNCTLCKCSMQDWLGPLTCRWGGESLDFMLMNEFGAADRITIPWSLVFPDNRSAQARNGRWRRACLVTGPSNNS
jgi:hypothetical protein